jgi:hypothetical protein
VNQFLILVGKCAPADPLVFNKDMNMVDIGHVPLGYRSLSEAHEWDAKGPPTPLTSVLLHNLQEFNVEN